MMLIRDQAGRTARLALYSGIVWLFVAAGSGLFAALTAAGLFPGSVSQLQPVFLNTFLFGWVAMAGTSLGLFIVQRTLGIALHNEPLGQFSVWLWNAANAGGVGALLLGYASPGPFPGYVWPAQLAWLLALLLLLVNVARTLNSVREPFFASTSYMLAALTWGAAVYFVGNGLWLPGGFGIHPLSALLQGAYAQSVVWLWAAPLAAGVALYVAAAGTGRPLYSRKLAHLGLWGLALHAATGVQRLWGAAVPEWVYAVSVGAGALTLVATLAIFANVTSTVGKGERAASFCSSPPGKLLRTGMWLLLIAAVAAALQPLTVVQQYVHGTQLVVLSSLTAMIGATLLLLAGVYELLPMLRRPKDRPDEPLYTERVANLHALLSIAGAAVFVVGLLVGGSLQAAARAAAGVGMGFAAALNPGIVLQAIGIGLLLAGQVLLVWTVARAAAVREPVKLPVIVTNPSAES